MVHKWIREGLKKNIFSVEFSTMGGGGPTIFHNLPRKKMVIFSKLPKQQVIAGYKVTPLFLSQNYKNNDAKNKSYPPNFQQKFRK